MVFVELKAVVRAVAAGAALALLLPAGDAAPPPSSPPPVAALPVDRLLPADLVFRAGRGARADLVRLAGDSWTHVGLLDRDPSGGWVVVHAAPPEAGSGGGVIETPLAEFASGAHASAIAVYRVAGLDPRSRALVTRHAHRLARARVQFDESLDLASPDRLYCTELVHRLFAGAGADLGVAPSAVSVGGLSAAVLMPSDLIAAPRLRRIF